MNIPRGLNDLLPDEVLKKRFLEEKICQIFSRWGYREIMVPSFELYEILARESGLVMKKEMIKFFDREGNIIALRPEMTTSIARLVSTKMRMEPRPLRLNYIGNVFRYDDALGCQREFCQAGAELVGTNNRKADAEIIALAVECLKNSGLNRFFIDIVHVNFFNGIMESLKVSEQKKQKIKSAILNKDFVLLEKILSSSDINQHEKEFILKIPTLRGGLEVLFEAKKMAKNKMSISALKEIEDVYGFLEDYGLKNHVLIDLGIIRNFDYYTGIIFEGYTDYLGYPVCGGGRYDNLCSKFGENLPATGFAIGIERLAAILEKENANSFKTEHVNKYFIYYGKDRKLFRKAISIAKILRKKGYAVELESSDRDFAVVLKDAKYKGMNFILLVEDNQEPGQIKRVNTLSGKEDVLSYE